MLWFSSLESWSIVGSFATEAGGLSHGGFTKSDLEIHFLGHERVDAAFDFVEASPPARPLVFAVGRLLGAGPAADGTVTLVVQWIVGDLLVLDVFPDGFAGPMGHRVELDDVTASRLVKDVYLHDINVGPGVGLLPAQAGNPTIEIRKPVAQRQHFPDRAAQVGLAFPEFRAIDVRLFLHRQVRFERLDAEAEEVLEALFYLEGFGEKQ